jgi:hypothetical protein
MGKMWAGAISGALAARAFIPRAIKRLRERPSANNGNGARGALPKLRTLCDSTAQPLSPKQYLERLAKVGLYTLNAVA